MSHPQINTNRILLQSALSGELNEKLAAWRDLRDQLGQIATEYEQMLADESLLESDYYREQFNTLEKDFKKKTEEFHYKAGMLRAIFAHPVYFN
jgi:hypothetical protein